MPLPAPLTVDAAVPYLGGGNVDEPHLTRLLDGVVGLVQLHTGRNLTPPESGDPDTTAVFEDDMPHRWIRVPDAREITSVTADGVLLTTSDYRAVKHDAGGTIVHLVLKSRRALKVEIVGKFGITPLPAELVDAIYAHAARNFRERDAQYADQVEYTDGSAANFFRQLLPRVRHVYQSYIVHSDRQGLT